MTAEEVMDVIERLPGCAGQAADAVSAYSQVKMGNVPKLLNIQQSVQIMDAFSTTEVAQIIVKHRRFSGSSRTKFVWTPTCWSLVGKTVRGRSVGTWTEKSAEMYWMGENAELRVYFRSSETKVISVSVRG